MKLYTGGGDKGQTSLFSGERVAKHHARIDAYGDLDELNSLLGALAPMLPDGAVELGRDFAKIQRELFVAGAWLATTPGAPAAKHLSPFGPDAARELERRIDALSAQLPPLTSFILPGGAQAAAWTHVARTVCRRCERKLTLLMESETLQDDRQLADIQIYLNRLSDYLFVAARSLNRIANLDDIPWK